MLSPFAWNTYTEHARALNMILLTMLIAGLTANAIVRRNKMTRRLRRITGWIFLILLNIVYAYALGIRAGNPYNASVGVGSILLCGTVIAIIWNPEGDDETPPHDGAVTSRFMFWLNKKVVNFKTRHHLGGYK